MINFYFGQNLAHCAWWWWLFGVSFSPLPSTMVEVVVVDDIVAVILWKIPLGSAFWVWKCQRQNRGEGGFSVIWLSYFMTCIFIHCTIMRMVFKSRVCVCVNWSPSSSRIFMHVDFPGNVKYKSPRKCLHEVCMISPWFACIYPANIAPYFVLNNFNSIVKPKYTARK